MTKYLDEKRYNGKVQAVILDWSGTTADKYVIAPAVGSKMCFTNMVFPLRWRRRDCQWDCGRICI